MLQGKGGDLALDETAHKGCPLLCRLFPKLAHLLARSCLAHRGDCALRHPVLVGGGLQSPAVTCSHLQIMLMWSKVMKVLSVRPLPCNVTGLLPSFYPAILMFLGNAVVQGAAAS